MYSMIFAMWSMSSSVRFVFFLFYLRILRESVSRRAKPRLKEELGSFKIHLFWSLCSRIIRTNCLKKSRSFMSAIPRLRGVGIFKLENNFLTSVFFSMRELAKTI